MRRLLALLTVAAALLFAAAAQASLGPEPRPPASADYPYDNGAIVQVDYLYLGEADARLALQANVFNDFGITCSSLYDYRNAYWDASGRLAGFFPCATQYRQSSAWTARVSRQEVKAAVFIYRPSQRVDCHYTGTVRKFFSGGMWAAYVVAGTQSVTGCATY